MGITNLNKKYELDEIVKGDSIFCATGITTNEVLSGIDIKGNNYTSETLVTHKNSKFKEIVKRTNPIKKWFPSQEKNGNKKKLIKIQ